MANAFPTGTRVVLTCGYQSRFIGLRPPGTLGVVTDDGRSNNLVVTSQCVRVLLEGEPRDSAIAVSRLGRVG